MPGPGGFLVLGGWSGGCLLLGGVSAPGGVYWGGLLRGVCVCSQGRCVSAPEGGCVSAPGGMGIPACTEADTPPPPVDRQTLVKILPWPNFVAAGKYNC